MCSILKKFFDAAKKDNSLAVNAVFYKRKVYGIHVEREEVDKISLLKFDCKETNEKVVLTVAGFNSGRQVNGVVVELPKKFTNGSDNNKVPFYYKTAETECITFGEFLPEGKKFRTKELGLFTRNQERTSGDDRFSDFTLEYQVDWMKTKAEVDNDMQKGVFDEWISK